MHCIVRFAAVTLAVFGLAAVPMHALEDVYEEGSDSRTFTDTINGSAEHYRKRIAELGPVAHHLSPAYSAGRTDAFWDRVNAEAPNPKFVAWSLVRTPKHLVWDTPVHMGVNLKRNYWDTWSQSDGALDVGSDLLTGIPNTMMLAVNGCFDTATSAYTDLYQPVLGGVVLWPLRFVTGLLEEPAPPVYTVLDAVPKTLWSVSLS
jgi:hypothetical protein